MNEQYVARRSRSRARDHRRVVAASVNRNKLAQVIGVQRVLHVPQARMAIDSAVEYSNRAARLPVRVLLERRDSENEGRRLRLLGKAGEKR
jgi:hypothetical protein